MNNQKLTRDAVHCYECQVQADERCSYCLLPVCSEHGKYVRPWFTSRLVMVCTPCQAKLEEIARQEQSLQWTPRTELHTGGVRALTGT